MRSRQGNLFDYNKYFDMMKKNIVIAGKH